MTLLFTDGFDHYATADIAKKWTYTAGSTSILTTSGRRGVGCASSSFGGSVYKSIASESTVVVGFALQPRTFHSSYTGIVTLRENTTQHLTLALNITGKFTIYRGSIFGTALATGTVTLSLNTWYYVEFKATINDSTGATEVRINGVADSSLTLTGVDTRNAGTSGVVNIVEMGQVSNGAQAYYDDFYICNTSGSTNNDFLGDCRVDTIFPNSDGNYTQFTPSTGTTHYTLVDEATPNTTDYVSDATTGDRDSYGFPDLAGLSSQTVYAVQLNAYAKKSDASATRAIGTMSRLSSTNKDGSGTALSDTSWVYVSEIQETDPASASWTESNVNAAEFGVKVTA